MSDLQPTDEPISIESKIENLELSVTKLIQYCEKLKDENIAIKHSNSELMQERSELQKKMIKHVVR